MSGQWQPRWERLGGAWDPLQSLLAQEYQRKHKGSAMHTHRCLACEQELTCACRDRRQVDRQTGKRRELYCLSCYQVQTELLRYEGIERG